MVHDEPAHLAMAAAANGSGAPVQDAVANGQATVEFPAGSDPTAIAEALDRVLSRFRAQIIGELLRELNVQ